jgi:hypothetical protein
VIRGIWGERLRFKLLGFVLRMGVSPWIEETEFVEEVRAVAQVQAFRGYRLAKQRLMYKGLCQRRGSESTFLAVWLFFILFFLITRSE